MTTSRTAVDRAASKLIEIRSQHPQATTIAAYAAFLAVVVFLGVESGPHTTYVFGIVILFAALPLINGRPSTWIMLAITLVWTSRLLTVVGQAPRFLDFIDFPLVIIAFLFSAMRFLATGRYLEPPIRKICMCTLPAVGAIAVSWLFNNIDEPQRLIAGWIMALEPFLLLLAILLAPMTARERQKLLVITTVLLGSQIAFSSLEILAGARLDDVKGTLLKAGAGHHVSAGGTAIGFMILARQRRVPKIFVLFFGVAALVIEVIADAKQVMFVLPTALLVLGITGMKKLSAKSIVGGVLAGTLMASVALYAMLSYQATQTAITAITNSASNDTGKPAVINAMAFDLSRTVQSALFGLGPGESVSRFAYLTTPKLFKAGSPVATLGLSVSRDAQRYQDIAYSGAYNGGNSSFNAAQSSALGIVGDYGILGLIAFSTLIFAIFAALKRSEDASLRSSAFACWAMLLPLAVVFDWLEQPPFTLAVMIVTGIALRGPASLSDSQAPAASRNIDVRTP